MKAIHLAEENGQQSTLDNAISLLSFYTQFEKLWLTIVRPQIVKTMCSYLSGHDEVAILDLIDKVLVYERKSKNWIV